MSAGAMVASSTSTREGFALMRLRFPARDIPVRLVTGAYIAHSGLEKWHGSAEQAEGLHGTAATAFPFVRPIPPRRFLRMLAAGELVTGTLLLAPPIPNWVAGSALTVFSGGLVAMYARTPAMHKPGSILSLIHISEPTRLGMISYAVFCL